MILTNIQNICTPGRISPLAATLLALAFPRLACTQDESVQIRSAPPRSQIIVSQIMTNKRPVCVQALRLTDAESRGFWPV